MSQQHNLRIETLLIHGGTEPGPAGATNVPIVQASAFAYEAAEDLEDVFRGRRAGQIYTRLNNPTTESLERRLALLEGGIAAVATASGMAAISTAVLTILRAGDELLSSSSLFGGTYSLFRDTLSNYGIVTKFIDPTDTALLEQAVSERTRLIFIETIGNPKMDVPDISAIATIAREAGVPLMVDATVTSPYLARGRDLGADIVIHSTSKFINGTGSVIGGAIVDAGTFDWNSPKFPHFEQFVKKYRQFAFSARLRKLMHKDLGACPAPMNSFLLTEGIETLALRMDRHCENALKLATFLNSHPKVKWVNYPGLADSPFHDVATRQYGGKYGGLLTFGLPGKEEAFRLINGLRIAKNLANIGDAKTLVIHPASTICCDYSADQQRLLGVSDELVRVSVGLEHSDDIIGDFADALNSL
ncbi:O-acetylhomoserine aminocarboxypropyltransferase/cysteine synthase family protein [Geobacter sp. DSM 9736]|uniref:O-acetylhomoserine aminocarboxypropyltransferase/cysteine synthase family protein n=1 Tax=Geobacter sp. DSM 9736 TaxID=1277350 RepID=UPI000B505E52|nr:O-acetylhomoserine aminocarboxypropyltransferase/cysteine synthase family protein [Geobacter sp. DSM 9736]SNB45114.1 O-acetylhomoserine sulfhydrylase [Geobacter sp. DSM 9736]